MLPVGLGFAAGAKLWMVAPELLPDALAETPARTVWEAATGAMIAFQLLIGP